MSLTDELYPDTDAIPREDPLTRMPGLSDDDLRWALTKGKDEWGLRLWQRLQNEGKRREAERARRGQ